MDNQEERPRPESGAQPAAHRRPRVYHGWFVVAAAMVISAAAVGVSDNFSHFRIFFKEVLNVGPDLINIAHLTGVLMGGFTQPILGYLFDRLNSRKVILVSVAVAGVATLSLTLTPWFIIAAFLYGVMISTAGGVSFGILGPLAARWFLRRRTLVLALLMSVPPVGSIFLGVATTHLSHVYGWGVSGLALGAILLFLALPVGVKFLRNWPSEMGLKADGDPESPEEASKRGSAPVGQRGRFEVVSWQRAFRSPPIWVLLLAFAVGGFAANAARFLVFFAVESMGTHVVLASILTSVMAMLGVMGVLAGGWLADRFPRKRVLGAVFLAQGIAFLALTAVQTPAGLWLFAVLAGLSGTAWMLLAFLLIADIYGLRALATLWGIAFLFNTIGSAIGPSMAAFAIGFTGSYVLPMAAGTLMLVLASIMVFAINERKYSARYSAAIGAEVVGN